MRDVKKMTLGQKKSEKKDKSHRSVCCRRQQERGAVVDCVYRTALYSHLSRRLIVRSTPRWRKKRGGTHDRWRNATRSGKRRRGISEVVWMEEMVGAWFVYNDQAWWSSQCMCELIAERRRWDTLKVEWIKEDRALPNGIALSWRRSSRRLHYGCLPYSLIHMILTRTFSILYLYRIRVCALTRRLVGGEDCEVEGEPAPSNFHKITYPRHEEIPQRL